MRFDELDLGTRLLPYEPTWQLQREVHAAVADGTREDVVLLCEHEDVYTAGKRTAKADRPVDGTPVVDVDRGGRITWHGPGTARRLPDRPAGRARSTSSATSARSRRRSSARAPTSA